MQLNDYGSYFAQNAASRNISFSQYYINYTYGILPLKFSIYLNVSTTNMAATGEDDKNTGATLGFNKAFFKSAFTVNASAGMFLDKRDDGNSNILNLSANMQYNFLKKHGLNLLFYYTNNKPKNISSVAPGFTELRGELGYMYNF
jgi:outer membrane usher protein FimD/PapC